MQFSVLNDLREEFYQNYPILYLFNDDLWNFRRTTNLSDLIDKSINERVVVVVVAAMNLFDFPVFQQTFFEVSKLLTIHQDLVVKIEKTVKMKHPLFKAFSGFNHNGYGAIRLFQYQVKKENLISLLLVDNPVALRYLIPIYNTTKP